MNKNKTNHKVILNLIQDLQRLPLLLVNNLRGRSQDPVLRHYGAWPKVMPRFGMTSLFNNGTLPTHGFTLIELLVVVLIIGILAAVAVPQYQKAVAKAHVTEAIVALKALSDAEEVYFLANGTYTENLNALDTSIPPTSNYYTYSCFDNQFSSCIARPTQDGYPVLEFVFLNHSSSDRGKHWCQTFDAKDILTETGKQKAIDICKTFGPQDTAIGGEQYGPYYLIQ